MGQCFFPDCKHQSESHKCRFFKFPSKTKKKQEYGRWVRLVRLVFCRSLRLVTRFDLFMLLTLACSSSYRRQDREPNGNSRVCSCHFRDGVKEAGPKIFARNEKKLFPSTGEVKKPRTSGKGKRVGPESIEAMVEAHKRKQELESEGSAEGTQRTSQSKSY